MDEIEGPALNMAKRDYYEILGVAPRRQRAGSQIRLPQLAKECHPDRNPGDKHAEQRFKELNEAYEALKDPQKRAAYDQFGHAAFEHGGGGGGGGFGPDFASSMSDIFDDLFGEFMGGRRGGGARRAPGASAAPTCATIIEITLNEAFAGKTAQIRVPTSVACETCSGIGRQAPAPSRRPARPAAAWARCAPARASSPSSAPARPARAAAR